MHTPWKWDNNLVKDKEEIGRGGRRGGQRWQGNACNNFNIIFNLKNNKKKKKKRKKV